MSLKVDQFIESLNEKELVYLYEQVTDIAYIGLCADEMRKQTSKFVDDNTDNLIKQARKCCK
jgi:hypothetical protein|tara:strand:- start:42 stop:227 length:186 start_codon:yes stop_codon:yes gene_type:complete